MRIRGSLGIMLFACGIAFLSGCGDDNEGTFGQTPTRTVVVPTVPPTNTSGPQAPTNTPGATVTPGVTNTPAPTAPPGSFCGNNVIDAGEECDCGAVCLQGDAQMVGQSCLADADCGAGGDCQPVGGQPTEDEETGELPGACPDNLPGPCAANCTLETAIPLDFANLCASTTATPNAPCLPDSANQCGNANCAAGTCGCISGTGSRVQLTIGPVFLPIQGGQTFRIGKPRSEQVVGPLNTSGSNKVLFQPNDVPLALRDTDFFFEQIKVPSLSCACVRAFPLDEFGPGLAGVGVISCGTQGLPDVTYHQIVDHNTGVIPDAQCKAQPGQGTTQVNGTEIDGGTCANIGSNGVGECQGPASGGVRWRVGNECDMNVQCNDPHPGICNYLEAPPTFSPTIGPRGSSVLKTFTSVSSISDGGSCATTTDIFDNGEDGIPCTDDDRGKLEPLIQFTTTGTASASVANANPTATNPTMPTGTNISLGSQTPCTTNTDCTVRRERCFNVNNLAQACQPGQTCECRTGCGAQACVTTITGALYDCDLLLSNPAQGLATGTTVISFGSLHAAAGLDLVATTSFKLTVPPPAAASEEP